MTIATLSDAAVARRGAVAAPADRPSQRRSSNEPGSLAHVRVSVPDLTVRDKGDGSGLIEFVGHASVTETGYEMWDYYGPYTEIVSAGAFDETLLRSDLDVPLVLVHDQLRRIARTVKSANLRLSMDEVGLLVEADLDPADVDVAYIVPKLRAGLIDEMSFAFRILKGQWSPDYTEYRIDKVDLHRGDVAIVGWGANPHTDAALRAAPSAPAPKTGRSAVTGNDLRAYSSLLV